MSICRTLLDNFSTMNYWTITINYFKQTIHAIALAKKWGIAHSALLTTNCHMYIVHVHTLWWIVSRRWLHWLDLTRTAPLPVSSQIQWGLVFSRSCLLLHAKLVTYIAYIFSRQQTTLNCSKAASSDLVNYVWPQLYVSLCLLTNSISRFFSLTNRAHSFHASTLPVHNSPTSKSDSCVLCTI